MVEQTLRILAPCEPFAVADWKAWWNSHAILSLEDIRIRLRHPIVHGTGASIQEKPVRVPPEEGTMAVR